MDKFKPFHKFSNTLIKLERNTERKYSMQVMSTATTTTTTTIKTKWKFSFTRGFMLVLELKSFYSKASIKYFGHF